MFILKTLNSCRPSTLYLEGASRCLKTASYWRSFLLNVLSSLKLLSLRSVLDCFGPLKECRRFFPMDLEFAPGSNFLHSLENRLPYIPTEMGVWGPAGPRHLFSSSRDYKVVSGTSPALYGKEDGD